MTCRCALMDVGDSVQWQKFTFKGQMVDGALSIFI
jgi:hypothetical protein